MIIIKTSIKIGGKMKKLIVLFATIFVTTNVFASELFFNTNNLIIEPKSVRRVAIAKSFFNGYYFRADFYIEGDLVMLANQINIWKKTRAKTILNPVSKFTDIAWEFDARSVNSLGVGSGGNSYLQLLQMTQARWNETKDKFEAWNMFNQKCSLSYNKGDTQIYSCIE